MHPLVGASGLMLSCYWVQPAQLHPWFKPATLKRKSPSMSLRSESPSPVDDEDDPDARIKRPRRTTTFTLIGEHTRPQKRKLPSFPQSPTEEEEAEGDLASMAIKRQRCTTLECGIESLSLTPPSIPVPAPPPPEFTTRLPASPDFRWLPALPPAAGTPSFQQISSPTNLDPSPILMMAPVLPESTDAIEDIKMRSSSWYEPEKDSACGSASFFIIVSVPLT